MTPTDKPTQDPLAAAVDALFTEHGPTGLAAAVADGDGNVWIVEAMPSGGYTVGDMATGEHMDVADTFPAMLREMADWIESASEDRG